MTASPARPPAVLQPVVFAVDGEVGWRHALLDADWTAWVCPRGHRTRQEADGCREKNGLHPEQMDDGMTLDEVADYLSIPYEPVMEAGDAEVWMPVPPAPGHSPH